MKEGSLWVRLPLAAARASTRRGASRTWPTPLTHLDGGGGGPPLGRLPTGPTTAGVGQRVWGPRGATADDADVLALEGLVGREPHRGDAEMRVVGTRADERHARAVRLCVRRGRVGRAPLPEGTSMAGPRLAWPGEKNDRDRIAACVTASGATAADEGAPDW